MRLNFNREVGEKGWRRHFAPPESNQEQPRFQMPSEKQNQQFLSVTSIKIFGQSISKTAFGQF